MIGNSPLRIIICADLFAAVPGPDLTLSIGSTLGILLLALYIIKLGAEHLERLVLVFELRTLLLTLDNNARGLVCKSYGGFCLVNMLTARTA